MKHSYAAGRKEAIYVSFKKRLLTESDIRIIESHSKKNLTDTINENENGRINYHDDMGIKSDMPIGKA